MSAVVLLLQKLDFSGEIIPFNRQIQSNQRNNRQIAPPSPLNSAYRRIFQPNPNNLISSLPFDSDLFGYPVGKFQANESWNETGFLDQAKPYSLVYIFSILPLSIQTKHIRLVDVKLTFSKKLLHSTKEEEDNLQSFSGPLTDKLLELSLESGVFSRFKTDPDFVNGEFEKLYTIWIEKAVTQEEVLVAKNQAGFVSCSISGKMAQIGLIAVDQNHRGKGWGKRLVQAAEQFAIQKGAESMSIATQDSNAPAVALYQKLGYNLAEKTFVYHYRP